jgi:hypothetical protein
LLLGFARLLGLQALLLLGFARLLGAQALLFGLLLFGSLLGAQLFQVSSVRRLLLLLIGVGSARRFLRPAKVGGRALHLWP